MAARECYWLGFVLGNNDPNRTISWNVGPTEHCADCLKYSQHGPYSIEEFKRDVLSKTHLPQAGSLKCLGIHCQCHLEEGKAA